MTRAGVWVAQRAFLTDDLLVVWMDATKVVSTDDWKDDVKVEMTAGSLVAN